jgi:methyl halide transferase
MTDFDASYWENRWREGQTGWDIGHVSTPIREYADQLIDKSLRILIPGCGSGYEAEYLHRSGFNNVWLMDFSPTAVKSFMQRVPDFPGDKVLLEDFFLHEGQYDLIIEQTLFCAISPELRTEYAAKAASLLVPGGKLAGLLFSFPLTSEGPPFGGSAEEYIRTFSSHFKIRVLEEAYNSIAPRAGRELFVIFEKG